MMRQMREHTKWIMLVTATAFVGLMVFQWGMDATGRTSGSLGEIGRVNGTPVQYEAYMGAYRNMYDQTQIGQTDPISTQQNRELEQAAWDQMVDGILIRQELDRRSIDVTDEEIRQAARFQTTSQFPGKSRVPDRRQFRPRQIPAVPYQLRRSSAFPAARGLLSRRAPGEEAHAPGGDRGFYHGRRALGAVP